MRHYTSTVDYLQKAKKRVIVENNGTGQFGQLIRMQTGFNMNHKILKYDGLPFSVEELEEQLRSIL